MKIKKTTIEACRLLGPSCLFAGLAIFFFGKSSQINECFNVISGLIIGLIGFMMVCVYLGNFEKSSDRH